MLNESSSLAFVYAGLLFFFSSFSVVCAQGNFSMGATSYDCTSNLICLGDAHSEGINDLYAGRLSLIQEFGSGSAQRNGIAYYNKPIRMLDPSTLQSVSFNTSFAMDQVPLQMNYTNNSAGYPIAGDGVLFVLSADNSSMGSTASYFGFFEGKNQGDTNFKSVAVEFDNYQNLGAPQFDISNNHVSFDFQSITYVAAANASDVGIILGSNKTTFAWVEYSAVTQQLEVRISNSITRPHSPLLNYTVNLFNLVEEYMWVGFTGSNGGQYSYYYIGNWTFEAYGIPLPLDPTVTKPRSKVGLIVGIAVGVPVLLATVAIIICFAIRRALQSPSCSFTCPLWSPPETEVHPMLQLSGMPEGFSYKQLSVATGSFSEESKLGQGGFGSVYRGVLPTSGMPVAVKKISADSKQGEKEFMAEVSIISQLRHRNLIQLMGWCGDRGKYLLVYELMPNGSLDKALFRPADDSQHSSPLSWSQRLNIVTGTAAAVDYLHRGWKQQVIHRDIKASNIMLDDEWNARLGDFGLARLVDHQGPAATTMVAGTYGYIAPEAAASGRFTDKTDVFAFGAVVLEIACGRKAFAANAAADEILLVDWVWQRLSEHDLLSVVDRRLGDYDKYWMEVVLLMGLLCSHPDPMARPSMRDVVQVLTGGAPVPSVPVSKPAPMFGIDIRLVSIKDLHRSTG